MLQVACSSHVNTIELWQLDLLAAACSRLRVIDRGGHRHPLIGIDMSPDNRLVATLDQVSCRLFLCVMCLLCCTSS